MRTIAGLLVSALSCFAARRSLPGAVKGPVPSAVEGEVVAAIQVHGNTLTSTDEIIRASGIGIGDRVSDTTLSDAEARLRAAIKLDSVDVLKRFASISDPTQVLILIQVDEGPVRVDIPDFDVPIRQGARACRLRGRSVVRRSRFNVMFVPILGAEDGYGFTYGAQFAFAGPSRHTAPGRRAGELGRRQAHRRRISAGVLEGVSRRACGRARSFRGARIRSSIRTPTGRACGDGPNGRFCATFMPAPRSRGSRHRSRARTSTRDRSARMWSSTRGWIR